MADQTTDSEIDRTSDKYIDLLKVTLAGSLSAPEFNIGHTVDRAFQVADHVYNRLYNDDADGGAKPGDKPSGPTYPVPGQERPGDDPANPAPIDHPTAGADPKPEDDGNGDATGDTTGDKPADDKPTDAAPSSPSGGDVKPSGNTDPQQPVTDGAPPAATPSADPAVNGGAAPGTASGDATGTGTVAGQ